MLAGASPTSARAAPVAQAIRARATASRLTDTQAYLGGPSSPSARATLNSTKTATAAVKQRPARIRHSSSRPRRSPHPRWVMLRDPGATDACLGAEDGHEDRHRTGRPGAAVAFGP